MGTPFVVVAPLSWSRECYGRPWTMFIPPPARVRAATSSISSLLLLLCPFTPLNPLRSINIRTSTQELKREKTFYVRSFVRSSSIWPINNTVRNERWVPHRVFRSGTPSAAAASPVRFYRADVTDVLLLRAGSNKIQIDCRIEIRYREKDPWRHRRTPLTGGAQFSHVLINGSHWMR
jgi:hypothetical protein